VSRSRYRSVPPTSSSATTNDLSIRCSSNSTTDCCSIPSPAQTSSADSSVQLRQGERGDERPFHGQFYELERPLNSPQSLSQPHPPIVVAGGGEQKTLRLVARYGDGCNLFPTPEIPHKLDVLKRHCDAAGRDYAAIDKTSMYNFDARGGEAGVQDAIAALHWLAWASRPCTSASPRRIGSPRWRSSPNAFCR
jgi:Luciferase-like monooxygenase